MTDSERLAMTMRILDAKCEKAMNRYHEAAQHGTEADRIAALKRCREVSEEIRRVKDLMGGEADD